MTKSDTWVTIRVNLTNIQERKFRQFHHAQEQFLKTGAEGFGWEAKQLKPYIDKHWDLYQAWKSQIPAIIKSRGYR